MTAGWYPDPGGKPDRYRYWDGTDWSPTTSADPSSPAPPPGTPIQSRSRRPAAAAIAIAVVVVAALLVIWIVRGLGGAGQPYTNDPPSGSVSAWDDSSPQPSPEPRSPSPSGSPVGEGLCASGQPDVRLEHPSDGRVHGGNLSFPAAPELDPAGVELRFSFAWDVLQQIKGVHANPGWIAQLAVGRLRAEDGFDGGAQAVVEQAIRCTITSNMYEPYTPTRTDRRAQPITLDGVRGWHLETDVTVAVSGLPFRGDRVHFIVVPDGKDWSFFFSAMPLGDEALNAVADRTREALTVS